MAFLNVSETDQTQMLTTAAISSKCQNQTVSNILCFLDIHWHMHKQYYAGTKQQLEGSF